MLTLLDMDWVRLELEAWHVKVAFRSWRLSFRINRSLWTVFSDVVTKVSSMISPLRHQTSCGNGLPNPYKIASILTLVDAMSISRRIPNKKK